MKDVVCPNCQKDEYRIVQINGIKVKQCQICGACYQLAEKEIVAGRVEKYSSVCKDAEGNFIKCPRCGRTDIKRVPELSLYEFIRFECRLVLKKYRVVNDLDEFYFCLNTICGYIWWKDADFK